MLLVRQEEHVKMPSGDLGTMRQGALLHLEVSGPLRAVRAVPGPSLAPAAPEGAGYGVECP